MNTVKLKLTGTSALIMHSDTLANPLDPRTRKHKELTSKRKQTEDDKLAIARSEFENSIYLDGSTVVLPTINIRSSIIDGAKLNKLGAAFQRGALIFDEFVPLNYDGPKDPAKLFDTPAFVDCRSVVVGRSRIMRYRPRFNIWSCEVDIHYDVSMIDLEDIINSAKNAGSFCGLGDFRPTKKGPFGRYKVEAA